MVRRHNKQSINSRNQINQRNRLYTGAMSRPSLTLALPRRVITQNNYSRIIRRSQIVRRSRTITHRRRSAMMAALPMGDRRRFLPRPLRSQQILRRPILYSGNIAPVRNLVQPERKIKNVKAYKIPTQTLVCVRRSIRKEVLFSSGKAGSNKRIGFKKMHRNATSEIRC